MISTKFPLATSHVWQKKINTHKWYLNHNKYRIQMIHYWNMQLHSTDASSSSHLLIHDQTWITANTKSKHCRNKKHLFNLYSSAFFISFYLAFNTFFFSLHVNSSYLIQIFSFQEGKCCWISPFTFYTKFHCTETTIFERMVLQ